MTFSSIYRFMQRDNHFLWIPFVLYLPFVFLGYGADSDSYETLRTGATFIESFDYIPSRNPGYVVFEILTLLLSSLGGSIATNLAAVLMSLFCLYGFYRLCMAFPVPNSKYLALIVALHPYYWVASTTTMDYVFALGFFFLGVSLLLGGNKPAYAGLLFSLAVGCRLTTALLVALVLALLLLHRLITIKAALVSLLMATPLSIVFYFPPLAFVGWVWHRIFRLVTGGSEYWSLFMRIGRFVYKNIVFWSAPVLAFLAWEIIYSLVRRIKLRGDSVRLIASCVAILLTYEILFFYAPLDPSYLLVILPFTVLIVGILLADKRKALLTLLLLVFISNFVVVNFARPNVKNFATDARYGLWLDPGFLVETTQRRIKVMDCSDLNCYESRVQD